MGREQLEEVARLARALVAAWNDDAIDHVQAIYDLADYLVEALDEIIDTTDE